MLFKKFFAKFHQSRWETTINGGGMIRFCRKTGQKEFRDSKNKKWIQFKDEEELFTLRQKLLYLKFDR